MKLYYGALSPFVRKVMVLAHEKNLVDDLERVPALLTPIEPNADLMRVNPLGKMPALALDDGTVLFDSPVVCEYLDTLGNGPRFFPASGAERWRALRLNALADGVLDAGINARVETAARPAEKQWDKWTESQLLKVRNALDAMNGLYAPSRQAITIGEIAAGCALGWLDFRMPQLNWREGRGALAAWFEEFSQRPSMAATAPKAS